MGRKFQYSVPFNYPVALLFVFQILAHHGPEDIWADVILSQNILADPLVPHGVLAHSSIFERQSGCSNSMRRYLARGGGGVLPYISYIGASPSGRVFAPFWSQNRYTLCPLRSGIGYGFPENYRSVWTYLSFQFQMSKKEREISKWI